MKVTVKSSKVNYILTYLVHTTPKKLELKAFHSENGSNVFRPHTVLEVLKAAETLKCTLEVRVHDIIITPFSKADVFFKFLRFSEFALRRRLG